MENAILHSIVLLVVQRSYWCGTAQKDGGFLDSIGAAETTPLLAPEAVDSQQNSGEYFESEPVGLRSGINIKQLRKVPQNITAHVASIHH